MRTGHVDNQSDETFILAQIRDHLLESKDERREFIKEASIVAMGKLIEQGKMTGMENRKVLAKDALYAAEALADEVLSR